MAFLATGNTAAAREAFQKLAPLSQRPPSDFRSALLAAYVEVASGPAAPRAP